MKFQTSSRAVSLIRGPEQECFLLFLFKALFKTGHERSIRTCDGLKRFHLKILYFIVFVLWIVSYLHPCERKVQHLLVSFHVCVKEHIAETTDACQPPWPRRPARGSFPSLSLLAAVSRKRCLFCLAIRFQTDCNFQTPKIKHSSVKAHLALCNCWLKQESNQRWNQRDSLLLQVIAKVVGLWPPLSVRPSPCCIHRDEESLTTWLPHNLPAPPVCVSTHYLKLVYKSCDVSWQNVFLDLATLQDCSISLVWMEIALPSWYNILDVYL